MNALHPNVQVAVRRAEEVTKAPASLPANGVIGFLSSLRVTVWLFGLATFLVLVGTLAQAEEGMWHVMAKYFRSFWCPVGLWVFFPRVWFPGMWPQGQFVWGSSWFPFPGGATIGGLMMVNLITAHVHRFTISASGSRLFWGVLSIIGSVLFTMIVIFGGQFDQVMREEPIVPPQVVWAIILALGAIPGLFFLFQASDPKANYSQWQSNVLFYLGLTLTALALPIGAVAYVMMPDPSAMRILWQLLQGTAVGVALYFACWLVFERRAGIVTIHAGVALLMFYEAFVSVTAVEERMPIVEGTRARYAVDTRAPELAFVEQKQMPQGDAKDAPIATGTAEGEKVQRHFLISLNAYSESESKKAALQVGGLPIEVKVLNYFPNSLLRDRKLSENTIATTGLGLEQVAVNKDPSAGANGGQEDMPSAYVQLFDAASHKEIGTYLVTTLMSSQQPISVGDKVYNLSLRFRRGYKPYQIELEDIRVENYVGTSIPKDYSSFVRVTDASRGIDRETRIFMNEPLRYGGETFYQSSYAKISETLEQTTLSVVTNTGWMAPYIACMIVVVGILGHFSSRLIRFLFAAVRNNGLVDETVVETVPDAQTAAILEQARGKRANGSAVAKKPSKPKRVVTESLIIGHALGIAAAVAILIGAYAGYRRQDKPVNGYDVAAFGKLPVVANGRTKPVDSMARVALTIISNNDSVQLGKFGDKKRERISATQWLLELASGDDKTRDYEIFRIENLELLGELKLTPKPQNFRYSVNEIKDVVQVVERELQRIQGLPEKQVKTAYENDVLDLNRRLQAFMAISQAFSSQRLLPKDLTRERFQTLDSETQQRLLGTLVEEVRQIQRVMEGGGDVPRIIPVAAIDEKVKDAISGKNAWVPFPVAAAFQEMFSILPDPGKTEISAVKHWASILQARLDDKPSEFNMAVAKYQDWLDSHAGEIDGLQLDKISFETTFNKAASLSFGMYCYLLLFIVSCLGLIGWRRQVSSFVFWAMIGTFIVHTVALGLRIWLSGRPPITNLYGTAIFVGWGVVALGILVEAAFRLNIGNIVASVGGYMGLMIAAYLSMDGDTIAVMQAVLDTQFWLATHVVTINLGYAATMFAGLFAVCYVLSRAGNSLGWSSQNFQEQQKTMGGIVYGATCFALFLSSFGTILGGLWADDSWGRFWGWDPKENGALMIVLWNALLLHARWGGLVKERGMAIIAVFGNIVTLWSWFGVNQLGIGLHSYGFTKGVLPALGAAVVVHLVIAAIGMLPSRDRAGDAEASPAAA
jgi:ABC-type transport system involved in cytochrome c biogenesis permease subunit